MVAWHTNSKCGARGPGLSLVSSPVVGFWQELLATEPYPRSIAITLSVVETFTVVHAWTDGLARLNMLTSHFTKGYSVCWAIQ